jgi:signal peptidase II
LNRSMKDYRFLIAVAGTVYILDQVTKFIVRSNIALGDIWSPWPWLTRYARIAHIKNTGAAFGMLPSFSDVITIISILVIIAILYYFPRLPHDQWLLRLALGLQMGGALGNLTDRLRQGYVTDFISVWRFPVFNIADASISIGVAILIISMWFQEQDKQPSEPSPPAEHTSEAASSHLPEDVPGE